MADKLPTGVQMMLKAMGIDPDKMLGDFSQSLAEFKTMADNVCAQLNRVETKCDQILTTLAQKEIDHARPDE